MCGIVGLISSSQVSERLLEALQRLEYRGYDSAGMATLVNGQIERRRSAGKLANLKKLVDDQPLMGTIGIGHTRWATHGAPNEINAHPHASQRVVLVHNGIIENHDGIREELIRKGYTFSSQTDTEVVTYLITDYLDQGFTPLAAVEKSIKQLEGAYALAVLFADYPDCLIGVRRGSPLVIGYGQGEMSIGSDALALAPWTQEICFLEEGDYAFITQNSAEIYSAQGEKSFRSPKKVNLPPIGLGKGSYRHYMLKEIFEQPTSLKDCLENLTVQSKLAFLKESPGIWASLEHMRIIACGTSFYAAMVAKYWFEEFARLPVEVDIASEFRYRSPTWNPKGLHLFISQSGETIDTLASLKMVRDANQPTLAIVNVPESSIARLSESILYTQAGPEVGVASTKAFTTQLLVLGYLALTAALQRQTPSHSQASQSKIDLPNLPALAREVLALDQDFHRLGTLLASAQSVIYVGRGPMYPLALEGALKLKEISYIHAEGCPAGELKHGPIALIDSSVPIIALCPSNQWFTKTVSNIQEIIARDGKVICLTDSVGAPHLAFVTQNGGHLVILPKDNNSLCTTIFYSIALQLIAYYAALVRDVDIDQPRNLAKSVTVE